MGINESCLSSCEGICWSLLDFVELNVLIYFLWGLPCCKHGILEAVKQLFLVLFCDSR